MTDVSPREGSYGKEALSWQTPEYPYHAKSRRWYLVAGIGAAAVIAYALLTGQYTTAVAFALMAIVYRLVHNCPERAVTITVTNLGIVIDGAFYQFGDIAHFWIIYDPPRVKRLHIRLRKRLSMDVSVELMDQDPALIRHVLEKYLVEMVGKTEHLSDRLTRWLKL